MRILALSVFLALIPYNNAHAEDSAPFKCEVLEDIDRIDFNEPSGIVFHPLRKTLFAVGDEGDICEIKTDGVLVKTKRLRRADFEGITCDPSTGLLYVAVEGEDKILEIDPENLAILREFTVDRIFRGRTVFKKGGDGIEAITFVPDSSHPQGGTFYVTNQSFDVRNHLDPSVVVEIELPLKERSKSYAEIINVFPIGIASLSGLYYDQKSNHIYVISSFKGALLEINRKGEILKIYNDLPSLIPEGIAIDDDGFVYIAQDSGGILKIRWDR